MRQMSSISRVAMWAAMAVSIIVLVPLALKAEAFTHDLPLSSAMATDTGQSAPSVRSLEIGLSGSITSEVYTIDLTGDGDEEVILGTSKGLYVISQGTALYRIPTPGPIMDTVLLNNGAESSPQLVLAVNDTYFPNIRCYEGATGARLWDFVPSQEVFIDNVMWAQQQTPTFDIEAVDLNQDGSDDIVATSGYNVFALDGAGHQLWQFTASNNLWRVSPVPDVDGDGMPDIVTGSQVGLMYLLSGKDGTVIWQDKIADTYTTINEKGQPGNTVDRSVWDIVPLTFWGETKAIVSTEDGKVRLIDLRDGEVEWDVTLVEYVAAEEHKKYEQKMGRPTSPGDANFFNIRLTLTYDVTGDGMPEVLAAMYTGSGGNGAAGSNARNSGLALIDPATGVTLFERSNISLEQAGQMDTTLYNDQYVLLVPLAKSSSAEQVAVLDLRNGTLIETLEIPSTSESSYQNQYVVKGFSDGRLLLGSDYGDLLMASSSEGVVWDYPRVTEVTVKQGDFTGDDTQDLLLASANYPFKNWGRNDPTARVLCVFDGATGEKAWSYQMPYDEFVATGGIGGVTVTPDINDDGKQDLVGYTQSGEAFRGESTGESDLILFSGKDGSLLLHQPAIAQTYYGVWEELYEDPSAIEQKLRERFEQQMETEFLDQWGQHEEEQRQQFEAQLQRELEEERDQGASESDLKDLEQRRREDLERQLEEEKEQWEQGSRENFEQDQLPRELEEWQRRLQDGENQGKIDKRVLSLSVMQSRHMEHSVAFFVATNQDVFLVSPEGEVLWTRSYELWTYQDPFTGEEQPEMQFGLQMESGSCYRVPGDLNGDGTDDLVGFSSQQVVVGLSQTEGEELEFQRGPTFDLEQGMDPCQGMLADDLDGDGTGEFLFREYHEGRGPTGVFVSPVTGEVVLRVEEFHEGSSTLSAAGTDLDGDGYHDSLSFRRWGEHGPELILLSGSTGQETWNFMEYRSDYLFGQSRYEGSVMPAAAIEDISGDGVADLAVAKNLIWQPGAYLVLYDVVRDEVIKEIALESEDSGREQDREWHPAFLVEEIGDWNGDGTPEVAVVTALGETAEEKQFRLIVVDIEKEEAIADFSKVGTKLVKTDDGGHLGLIGTDGGFYLLNAANNLTITSPIPETRYDSPVHVRWTGVPQGSFNQVSIDGVEVVRTNDNEVTLPVARGNHELSIRSVDEYGGGVYQSMEFIVEKGASPVLWTVLSFLAVCGVVMWLPVSRFITTRLRRGGTNG